MLKHGVIRLSAYLALTALYGLSFYLLILQDNATHAQDHPPLDWRSLEEPRSFSDIQPHFDLQAVTFDSGAATATQGPARVPDIRFMGRANGTVRAATRRSSSVSGRERNETHFGQRHRRRAEW